MGRLQRKAVRFLKRAKLLCIHLRREEKNDIEEVDGAKIFAVAYTGINPRIQ